ncbi:hypothetical protein Pmar_PMAR008255, partial [Perkinsus marinus ATCC 50983]
MGIEPFELGIADDTRKPMDVHHGCSTIVLLPDAYSSVIMDCDNINDNGECGGDGGSPDIDTVEEGQDRGRGVVGDDMIKNDDEDGGVLWSLKHNLMNKGLSWSDRLLHTTEAALDVTERAVGFILSDDKPSAIATSSTVEVEEGNDEVSGKQTLPGREGEVVEKEEEEYSLSEPALSVEELTSSDEDGRP